eukprot:17545-Heterococcus_DN1.PRE.5
MNHAQLLIFVLACCSLYSSWGYHIMPHGGSSIRKAVATAEVKQPAAVSRRDALMKCILSSASAAAALLTVEPSPAHADVTRQSLKKSYFRYVPRINEGMA